VHTSAFQSSLASSRFRVRAQAHTRHLLAHSGAGFGCRVWVQGLGAGFGCRVWVQGLGLGFRHTLGTWDLEAGPRI
jgi:hypothetical protein